jgi:hypothetical protein
VAGPFEALVPIGGEEVRGGLADLSFDLLRGCAPVRSPGAYQRQRHMPGRWFSSTAGRFPEYESLLERERAELLIRTMNPAPAPDCGGGPAVDSRRTAGLRDSPKTRAGLALRVFGSFSECCRRRPPR